jgi:eukaryotic translation initiation factor 2C
MELCKTELVNVKKLNSNETSQMIRKTAVACDIRKTDIEKMITNSKLDNDPILQNYNIQIKFEMTKIDGKVLSAPDLVYKNRTTYSEDIGNRGQWDNMKKQFLESKALGDWIIVNCSRLYENQLDDFISSLINVGGTHGIRMNRPLDVLNFNPNSLSETKAREIFTRAFNEYDNINFLLAILPGTSPAYGMNRYFYLILLIFLFESLRRFKNYR